MKISIDDDLDRLLDYLTVRGKRLLLSIIVDSLSDERSWKRFKGFDRKTYDELHDRIKDIGYSPVMRDNYESRG